MTVFPSGVSYITAFQSTNLSLGVGGTQSLFQASTVANEITYLNAKVKGLNSGADTYLVIGPTNLANPAANDGNMFFGPEIKYRGAGATADPVLTTVNTIYSMDNISWVYDASAADSVLIINNLIIQPGYFVYFRSGSGGSIAYNVQQITIKQS